MSSEHIPSAPSGSLALLVKQDQHYKERAEEVRPGNKTALFAALAAADITSVVAFFNGYGDSGQVESIDARIGDIAVKLPDVRIPLVRARWGCAGCEHATLSLAEALETLAYDLLEESYGGWENDEGAFGEFTFDVAARSITLDFNGRIQSFVHSQLVL